MTDGTTRFRAIAEQHDDLRDAVREYAGGRTLADLARDMDLNRATLNHTLAGYPDRLNAAARRTIETHLRLEPYLLDELIDE